MTKHKPTLVRSPQWWKHLRDWKRVFWKRDRRAGVREIAADLAGANAGAGKAGRGSAERQTDYSGPLPPP